MFWNRPIDSKEHKELSADIVAINKNILLLLSRVEKLETQLQSLRGKVYRNAQIEEPELTEEQKALNKQFGQFI